MPLNSKKWKEKKAASDSSLSITATGSEGGPSSATIVEEDRQPSIPCPSLPGSSPSPSPSPPTQMMEGDGVSHALLNDSLVHQMKQSSSISTVQSDLSCCSYAQEKIDLKSTLSAFGEEKLEGKLSSDVQTASKAPLLDLGSFPRSSERNEVVNVPRSSSLGAAVSTEEIFIEGVNSESDHKKDVGRLTVPHGPCICSPGNTSAGDFGSPETVANTIMRWAVPLHSEGDAVSSFMSESAGGISPSKVYKTLFPSSFLPGSDLHAKSLTSSLRGGPRGFFGNLNTDREKGSAGQGEEEEGIDDEVSCEGFLQRQKTEQLEKVTRDLNEAKQFLLDSMREQQQSFSLDFSYGHLVEKGGAGENHTSAVLSTNAVETREQTLSPQKDKLTSPSQRMEGASLSPRARSTILSLPMLPGRVEAEVAPSVEESYWKKSKAEGEKEEGTTGTTSTPVKDLKEMIASSSTSFATGAFHTGERKCTSNSSTLAPIPQSVSAYSSLSAGAGYGSPPTERARTLGTRLMETILTAAQVTQALEADEEEEENEEREVEAPLHVTPSFIRSYKSGVMSHTDGGSEGGGKVRGGTAARGTSGVDSKDTPTGGAVVISSPPVLSADISSSLNGGTSAGGGGGGAGAATLLLHDNLADPIESSSPFFHSENALESSHNRLREAILALNRPAQTDEELLWLFRHSRLLYLLPRTAQEYAVRASLRREFSRGETILENGAPIRHLYVVVWGEVDAFDVVSHLNPHMEGQDTFGYVSGSSHHIQQPVAHVSGSAEHERTRTASQDFPSIYSTAAVDPERASRGTQMEYRFLYSPERKERSPLFVSAIAKSIPLTAAEEGNSCSPLLFSPGGGNGTNLPCKATHEKESARVRGGNTFLCPALCERKDLLSYPAGGFLGGVGVHQGTLGPGQLFGVEQAVFDGSSDYCFRASLNWQKTVVALIPIGIVRQLLLSQVRFAQGVGDVVTAAVDVFRPIRDFCRCVFSASTDAHDDYLPLWSIVESYTHLNNVIHTKMRCKEVDTGAWGYALNRLPANVTKTFCFNLVHALPPFVASRMREAAQAADVRKQLTSGTEERASIFFINTKERRRFTWNLGMEGKTLVLLRDGFTDLLDFLTMICVHILESNKLRGRLQGMVHPPAIDVLDEYLRLCDVEERTGTRVSEEKQIERINEILQRMPLTKDEQAGLIRLWKSETASKLYEVMMHREEYNIRVDLSLSRRFQTNPFHEWALNLRACVMKKIGLQALDILPDDLYVDVVSSNTHCIKNLLSRFNRKYRSEILAYAKKDEVGRLGPFEQWHNEDDILYSSVLGFIQNERPDLKDEYSQSLEESGITVLNDTAMTGLQVDVIPAHSLHLNDIDATIRDSIRRWFSRTLHHGQKEKRMKPTKTIEEHSHKGAEKGQGKTASDHTNSNHCEKWEEEDTSSPLSPVPPTHSTAGYSSQFGISSPSWAQVCRPVYDGDGNPTEFVCDMPASDTNAMNHPEDLPSTTSTSPMSGGTPYSSPRGASFPDGSPNEAYDDANAFKSNRPSKTGVFRLRRHFIINMDFAFGAQAEGICRAVFSAFGHRIRSVSIMGKAGGLVGKRGDIQLATHVLMSKSSFIIEDNQDELRNCRNDDLHHERLKELAGPRVNVFSGNVLTVTGTMLQNVKLLRYYQRVWSCVGMEMEGSYFARVMEDFHQQGIARRDIISRFAYYTSDLPLGMSDAEDGGRTEDSTDSATLSAPMTPQEGVPPLYAIARAILERILLP